MKYYALRCVQTQFREKGDAVNDWKDERSPTFETLAMAESVAQRWRAHPAVGQVYVMTGACNYYD